MEERKELEMAYAEYQTLILLTLRTKEHFLARISTVSNAREGLES